MKRTLLTLSLLAPSAPVWAAGPELQPLREIAVQDGGRVKPLDSFARELAKRVQGARAFGFESVAGLEPAEWLLATLAAPERWKEEPVVRVTHAGLRQAAGLPSDKDRYSFQELADHKGLQDAVARVREKLGRNEDPDPVEREVLDLYDTLVIYQGVMSGESLHVVPHPDDPKAAWSSIADLAGPQAAAIPQAQRLRALVTALVVAYRDGDRAGVGTAASALGRRLAELAPAVYPAEKDLALEVHYNHAKPYRAAWLLYLLGFLALLASFPLASRHLSWAGLALVGAGFLSHAYGMVLRMVISGRPPVTNMYESVVWVAFGAVLFSLVFEGIYRVRIFAACSSALAVVCLILADNVPILDSSISPLVPVLRDNMWLTIHVLTITLGYAAFTLAMGIGHLNLGLYFFRPGEVALFKSLSLFLYRALQVGTLFLAVGTLLGGVWASYSWGRFWGWDPKETWALIATLGYLAILHARFTGWIKDFGMAVGSLLGYLLVLMAWYGVNFVLGTGLHSYGFGSGGYRYVGGFVAFEVLVIVSALLRHRSEQSKHAPAPTPAPAH
ncbi:MAG TPA: cytochrome c biogenesis protein CcsA [Vicinamibacteria bacterium]|nr:cytochrome c biogenesis protein CcsA [Vicinamibacteria bacterium]